MKRLLVVLAISTAIGFGMVEFGINKHCMSRLTVTGLPCLNVTHGDHYCNVHQDGEDARAKMLVEELIAR